METVLILLLTFDIERNNAFYNYYFEITKKAVKYYEIFLFEKKKVSPFNFFNITLLCFLCLFFFPTRPLRIGL